MHASAHHIGEKIVIIYIEVYMLVRNTKGHLHILRTLSS